MGPLCALSLISTAGPEAGGFGGGTGRSAGARRFFAAPLRATGAASFFGPARLSAGVFEVEVSAAALLGFDFLGAMLCKSRARGLTRRDAARAVLRGLAQFVGDEACDRAQYFE